MPQSQGEAAQGQAWSS